MDDSGLRYAERWELDHCTGLEWKQIFGQLRRQVWQEALVEERYEGNRGKIKVARQQMMSTFLPGSQISRFPNPCQASQATQVETFLVCRTAIAGDDEVFDF